MDIHTGSSKGIRAEINVVPLIDILLVLIIIFMVIAPLAPKGLEAAIPRPSQRDGPQEDFVVVQVDADNSVRVNQEEVGWDGLGPRLEAIFKARAQKVAFVRGGEVVFAQVARAMDIMKASGIEKVALMTAAVEHGR